MGDARRRRRGGKSVQLPSDWDGSFRLRELGSDPMVREVLGIDGPYYYTFHKKPVDGNITSVIYKENIFIPFSPEKVAEFPEFALLTCFSHMTPMIYFIVQPDLGEEFAVISLNRLTNALIRYKVDSNSRFRFGTAHMNYTSFVDVGPFLYLCTKAIAHHNTNQIARWEIAIDRTARTFSARPIHLTDHEGLSLHPGVLRDPIAAFIPHPLLTPLALVMRDGSLRVYNRFTTQFDRYKCAADGDFDLFSLKAMCEEDDTSSTPVGSKMGTPASRFSVMEKGPFVLIRISESPRGPQRHGIRRDNLYRLQLDAVDKEYSLRHFKTISYTQEQSLNYAFNERFLTVFERFCSWQEVTPLDVLTLSEVALWGIERQKALVGESISERSVKDFIGRIDDRPLLTSK